MNRFRYPTALVALAVSAAWSLAADLKVTGPSAPVPADKLVRLQVEGVEKDAAVLWDVLSADADGEETADGGFVFVGPKGRYTVKAREVRVEGGKTRVRTARFVVVIGDGPPTPAPPGPDPGPTPPDPTRTAARVTVVVVEETGGRTPAHGRVIYDRPTRDWLTAGRHEFELLEVSDPEYTRVGYKPFVDKVGLPAVLVFDADAKGPTPPLLAFRLPATGDELSAEIRKAVRK